MDRNEEEALIAEAKRRPEAFAPLYELHFGAIFRFILRRAGERELTNDLTQQTFLKAMLALPGYEPRGYPFKAFLYRIALNELKMHWRKRKEVTMDMSYAEMGQVLGLGEDAAKMRTHRVLATLRTYLSPRV